MEEQDEPGREKAAMKLPPDMEFHEDIRLLIYRPRGLLNEQSVNKIVSVIEDLEANLQEPFNRFFDTRGHDEVELNFRYVIQISLHRVLSYGGSPACEIGDSGDRHHHCPLLPVACHNHRGLADQRSNISRTRRSRKMARRSAGTAG